MRTRTPASAILAEVRQLGWHLTSRHHLRIGVQYYVCYSFTPVAYTSRLQLEGVGVNDAQALASALDVARSFRLNSA